MTDETTKTAVVPVEREPVGEIHLLLIEFANAISGEDLALRIELLSDYTERFRALANREVAAVGVSRDVERLVLAARAVAFGDHFSPSAIKELDAASEAFADRVAWDNEPDASPQGIAFSPEHKARAFGLMRPREVMLAAAPAARDPQGGEAWRPIEAVEMWADGVVTDGQRVALAQKAETDHGDWYWAVDGGNGTLEWEPALFIALPDASPQDDRLAGGRTLQEAAAEVVLILRGDDPGSVNEGALERLEAALGQDDRMGEGVPK